MTTDPNTPITSQPAGATGGDTALPAGQTPGQLAAQQGNVLVSQGQGSLAPQYGPPVSQTQDASQINTQMSGNQQDGVQFPNTPADQTANNSSTLASIQPTDLASLLNQNQAPTQTSQDQSSLKNSIMGMLGSIKNLGGSVDSSGKIDTSGALPGALDTAAKALGYKSNSDMTNQLQDVNNQINTLKLQAQSIPLEDQQRAQGTDALAGGVQGIDSARLRDNTIQALKLSAMAQTLQGNITAAQATANTAINAEFKPYELQLAYDTQLYNMNKDTLTREDAKSAAALQAQLADRTRLLTLQQENAKAGAAMANSVLAANKGNQAAQMAVQNANKLDPLDPQYLTKLGQLLNPFQTLDDQQKLAQLALTQAQATKARADAGVATGATIDPATVSGWVTSIKNGTAKLSDLTGPKNEALKNAVVQAMAQGGSSATDILKTTASSLKDLQTMIDTNHGFSGAVGAKGLSSFFGIKGSPIAGTAAADFVAKLNQVKNDVILPNLTLLHGLGRVTDREFQALTSAVTSLSTSESESQFKKDFATITTQINQKLQDSGLSQAGSVTGTLPNGTKVTKNADGSITDAQGNKYDANGNKLK